MRKIPTIFLRDFANKGKITREWHPDCGWVRDGEGVATQKFDGTSCLIKEDRSLWKRRELRRDEAEPQFFELAGEDGETGKRVGWVPVGNGPEDQYHREVANLSANLPAGTYELVGPKVQGNKDRYPGHVLLRHGCVELHNVPRDYLGIQEYFIASTERIIEGIVWHHPDGRMAKIKRRDFGLKW